MQKNLRSLISLEQTLRETHDSIRSNCTYSPRKEGNKRDILYVNATTPFLFYYTGQELRNSRDEAASNYFLHMELIDCVHSAWTHRKLFCVSIWEKTLFFTTCLLRHRPTQPSHPRYVTGTDKSHQIVGENTLHNIINDLPEKSLL